MKIAFAMIAATLAAVSSFAAPATEEDERGWTRIPITYLGVTISVAMPADLVNVPFPLHPSLPKKKGDYRGHTIWDKTWTWSRPWWRGGDLGEMHYDAQVVTIPPPETSDPQQSWNLLNPADLLEWGRSQDKKRGYYRWEYAAYDMRELNGVVWVRRYHVDKKHGDVYRAELWYLGISEDTFVRLDFAAIRRNEKEPGDRWLREALAFQNRMIGMIRVTGLKQVTEGLGPVIKWEFPKSLQSESPVPGREK